MNWRAKIAAFKVLSAMPGGSALYRFAQEHLTKSLDPIPSRVQQKLEVGLLYYNTLARLGKTDLLLKGVHLDFGAGWHPTIPLLNYSIGVNRQHLFDIVPVLNQRMVEETVKTFRTIVSNQQWPHRDKLQRLPPEFKDGDWQKYLDQLGISYHAPYAEFFPTLAGKIDVVTSTQVLLHIPRDVMRWCFSQIHRSLKTGGLFLATIHLRDLFADADPSISDYNHVRYSSAAWERWINSPLMSYNRFKARDYRELLEEAGFALPVFEIEQGTAEHLKQLERVPIAPCFQHYSREELAARHLFFVAQKL